MLECKGAMMIAMQIMPSQVASIANHLQAHSMHYSTQGLQHSATVKITAPLKGILLEFTFGTFNKGLLTTMWFSLGKKKTRQLITVGFGPTTIGL